MTLSKSWCLQEHCYNTAGPVSAAGLIGATLPQLGWRLQVCAPKPCSLGAGKAGATDQILCNCADVLVDITYSIPVRARII